MSGEWVEDVMKRLDDEGHLAEMTPEERQKADSDIIRKLAAAYLKCRESKEKP